MAAYSVDPQQNLSTQGKEDFSQQTEDILPEVRQIAQAGQLQEAIDRILSLEKRARLGGDAHSTAKLAGEIIDLSFTHGSVEQCCDNILLLSKRRAQLTKAISEILTRGMAHIASIKISEDKVKLIEALRTVATGKMYAEVERARLTQQLAVIREKEGNLDEASRVLQEVQVETYGSLDKREKANFLLEQMRLTTAQKDYIRAGIIANKVNRKILAEDGMEDLKLRFYELMVQYHAHQEDYFALFECYKAMYHTKGVEDVASRRKPILRKCIVYCLLAPFRSTIWKEMKTMYTDKHVRDELSVYQGLMKQFLTTEIIAWPLPEGTRSALQTDDLFRTKESAAWKLLFERVTQHNLRVLGKYYAQIRMDRLCSLLNLEKDVAEQAISSMVSDKEANQDVMSALYARIDRPAGIVNFTAPQPATATLNEWSEDITELLHLVERTSHLIHRENMVHKL